MSQHNNTSMSHERLDAYRVSLSLYRAIERIADSLPRGHADLKDQMRRSAGATVRNIAEAASRSHPKDRCARFSVARGECAETIASAEMAHAIGLADDAEFAYVHQLGARIAAMLVGLIRRNDGCWP